VPHRPTHWQTPRKRWYGVLVALLGVLSGVVSAFGLTATTTGEQIVAERAIDGRTSNKPTALRHDPADPSFNVWGGADPAGFVPASSDVPRPGLGVVAKGCVRDFGLTVRFALVRDGASRAPPAA